MRIAILLALAALAQLWGAALAKDIETKSAIVGVVVHPDAATVTREAAVDLPQGASTVVFTGVPFPLAPESLRASGEAHGALTIGAVEARATPADSKPAESPVAARLKELRAQRAEVDVTLEALKAKLAMIASYAHASPSGEGEGKSTVAVGDWSAAFDTIGAAHAKTGEEIRLATAKAHELDDEIASLAGAPAPARQSGVNRSVAIVVLAEAAGPAKLTLTYQTDAARWATAYDANLDTGGKDRRPKLEFVRRALVSQRTGEDWNNIALSVSTIGARRGASAPNVLPQLVSFPVPVTPKRAVPAGAAGPAPAPTDALKLQPAREAVAEVEASAFAASYAIAGPVSVPGDGSEKSFALAVRYMEPQLSLRTAPALQPAAYLEARLVNDDEAPLLPGAVAVKRDGLFVGRTRMALVAPGDDAEFGFGADDRVKVTRVPVKRREKDSGWFGQTRTDSREFKTSVKNLHDFPVSVTVVDRIPYSENAAITVETLPQTTTPTEKQVDDKRGVMAWSFELGPGEAKDIHLAYRLKWPADREIEFITTP
ncbi:MAG TPA: mucoidy inhibitor MuiA family protein [Methylocystis sp.]|nr:mucoidy inhibitor MuiA family protein [Methylocystis sp.]